MFTINYHAQTDKHFSASVRVADHDNLHPYYVLRLGAHLAMFLDADQLRDIAEVAAKALAEMPLRSEVTA